MIAIATTTWNAADLTERFLRHHQRQGVDVVYVMDYGSTDGTEDVLHSSEWRSLVRNVDSPGLEDLDSSNVLLELMQQELPADTLALFCDPDEFLVTDGRSLEAFDSEQSGIIIPRTNMTARRSAAEPNGHTLMSDGLLDLEIRNQVRRGVDLHRRGRLVPPWIWTAIGPKVAVRLNKTTEIGDGDHTAETADPLQVIESGCILLHHPIRTYEEFLTKAHDAKEFLDANPHLPPRWAGHMRRWVRMEAEGTLHDEYLDQFVSESELPELIASGRLRVNHYAAPPIDEVDAAAQPDRQFPNLSAPKRENPSDFYHRWLGQHRDGISTYISELEDLVSQADETEAQRLKDEAAILAAGVFGGEAHLDIDITIPALRDYLRRGQYENEVANELFDDAYYRDRYMSETSKESALAHYCRVGVAAGFRPNPALNPEKYRERRDLDASCDPLFYALLRDERINFSATTPRPPAIRTFIQRGRHNVGRFLRFRDSLIEDIGVEATAQELASILGNRAEPAIVATKVQALSEAVTQLDSGAIITRPKRVEFEIEATRLLGAGYLPPERGLSRRHYLGQLPNALVQGGSRLIRVGTDVLLDFELDEIGSVPVLLANDPGCLITDGVEVTTTAGTPRAAKHVHEAFDLVTHDATDAPSWVPSLLYRYVAALLAGLPTTVPILVPQHMPRWLGRMFTRLFGDLDLIPVDVLEEVSVESLWVAPSLYPIDTPDDGESIRVGMASPEVLKPVLEDLRSRFVESGARAAPRRIFMSGRAVDEDLAQQLHRIADLCELKKVETSQLVLTQRIAMVLEADVVLATDPMDQLATGFCRRGAKVLHVDVTAGEYMRSHIAMQSIGINSLGLATGVDLDVDLLAAAQEELDR